MAETEGVCVYLQEEMRVEDEIKDSFLRLGGFLSLAKTGILGAFMLNFHVH